MAGSGTEEETKRDPPPLTFPDFTSSPPPLLNSLFRTFASGCVYGEGGGERKCHEFSDAKEGMEGKGR